jgi:hypothetical protein
MRSHFDLPDRRDFGRNPVDVIKKFIVDATWRDVFNYDAEKDLCHVWTKAYAIRLNMSVWANNPLPGMDLLVIRRKLADGLEEASWTIADISRRRRRWTARRSCILDTRLRLKIEGFAFVDCVEVVVNELKGLVNQELRM